MRKICVIFVFLISFQTSKSSAQVTIFNVPSAEITKKNETFLQHQSQFRVKDPQNFVNATNYLARGIGYNTEIDVTQFNLSSPSSKNITLATGFKTVFLLPFKQLKNYQPKIIFGSMIPMSLQGQGVGNWTYSLGTFTSGFSYALPNELTLFGGYQIPNSKKVGRNSFVIEIAKVF